MNVSYVPTNPLPHRRVLVWRVFQVLVWLAGAAILFCLLFFPTLGVLLFWNILIPVAPALFVFATGVWRNVCPLATMVLLPRHLYLSQRKRLTIAQVGKLNLIAVMALYILVPLRHAVFNNSGTATALLIIALASVGIIMGFFYEWKSAWCSGLCPVHPVEKLYGSNAVVTMPNAHCDKCMNCVIPCPDATTNLYSASPVKTSYHKISEAMIAGGLPGFIWGWFHVPDETRITTAGTFISVYQMPMMGFAVTLVIYSLLLLVMPPKHKLQLISIFAAAGVSCYYWYRIPSLLGFGNFAADGLLINLKNIIPAWIIPATTITLTVLFFYWLVFRKKNNKSWITRPAFANKQQTKITEPLL
jgi:hypothetical protein